LVDKIQKVSNPLTIIAIFAGIAEVAATVALGLIEPEIQKKFIWFVISCCTCSFVFLCALV
jgi:multidrug transporter EmrE-like cation transporter